MTARPKPKAPVLTRKPSLRALAKSRGYTVTVENRIKHVSAACDMPWRAHAGVSYLAAVLIYAPTKRAALAGLRGALEALPEVRG